MSKDIFRQKNIKQKNLLSLLLLLI